MRLLKNYSKYFDKIIIEFQLHGHDVPPKKSSKNLSFAQIYSILGIFLQWCTKLWSTFLHNFRELGPQHLPLSTIIPISVVYSTIFIVGVLGNVATICVILKNKYMHTPTNVYLANLAISDLLTHLVGKFF